MKMNRFCVFLCCTLLLAVAVVADDLKVEKDLPPVTRDTVTVMGSSSTDIGAGGSGQVAATPSPTAATDASATAPTTLPPGVTVFRKGSGASPLTATSPTTSSTSTSLFIDSTGQIIEVSGELPTEFNGKVTLLFPEQEKWAREQNSDAEFRLVSDRLIATTEPVASDNGKVNGVRVTTEFTDKASSDKFGHKRTTEYIKDDNTLRTIVEEGNTRRVTQWQYTDKKQTETRKGPSVVYEQNIIRGGTTVRVSGKPLYADLGEGKYLNYEDGKIYTQSSAPTVNADGKVVFSGAGADRKTLGKDTPADKVYQEVKNARLNFRIKDTLEATQFHLTEFQGLSGFSSLFFKDKDLSAWRRTTEEFFCSTILLGGIDCWTSKICDEYDDRTGGKGVFIGTQVGGEKTAIAHIEAERSLPATFINGSITNQGTQISEITEYVYKLTYFVRNPNSESDDDDDEDSEVTYNIVFEPSGYKAFPTNKLLKPGASASAVGQAAIVKYSRKLYTKVCLVFSPALEGFSNEKVTRVCNNICGGIIDIEDNTCKPLETAIIPPSTAPKPTPQGGTDWSGF